jgi:hypothetical protein
MNSLFGSVEKRKEGSGRVVGDDGDRISSKKH